ncbi:MAG: DUF4054 domain-containing protein [Myxococcaceae bacterium]|nr:MAG: DUF4054 domain-containing protein [Myxococcaceae bacterium]
MPYTVPDAAQFKARFPVFEGQDDDYVTLILTEASASVDESWAEPDYQPAIMYLAAHMIATENSSGDDAEIDTGSGRIASESFGGVLSISYFDDKADLSSGMSDYASTIYGRNYLRLLTRNKPAIVAI